MQNQQYIKKRHMEDIRVCLELRKREGERIRMPELLNEILEMGIMQYIEERGVTLPEREEVGV